MGVNDELRKFISAPGQSASDGQPVRLSQQTRQLSVALPASGSGSGYGPHRSRLAPPVSTLGIATGTTDRQGGHGSETSDSIVLDVAQRMGLRAVEEVRFARGRARKSPGCAVDHRRND